MDRCVAITKETILSQFVWRALGRRLCLQNEEVNNYVQLLNERKLFTVGDLKGCTEYEWKSIQIPFESKKMLRFSVAASLNASEEPATTYLHSLQEELTCSTSPELDKKYNSNLIKKDIRDLILIHNVLHQDTQNWKKINWINDVPTCVRHARAEKKPILFFLRASLFGEVGSPLV